MRLSKVLCPLVLFSLFFAGHLHAQTFKYYRLGNSADVQNRPIAGFALIGGGKDIDPAFKWLCDRASGGDFLILRHAGDDAYNPYVNGLCKANSVSTLILPDRASADDPKVVDIVDHAEAIFIAGGDQATYINYWMNTSMNQALNRAIARGIPIGGTSAGLAVLGEFIYSAQGDKPDDLLSAFRGARGLRGLWAQSPGTTVVRLSLDSYVCAICN